MRKSVMIVGATLCTVLCALGPSCDAVPPSLRLFGPYSRDVWLVDYATYIGWQAIETGPEIRIELYRDGLGGAAELIGVFPANDDSQPWTPTGPTSESCVLKATDTSNPTVTAVSGVFRIVGPGLYVQGPYLSHPAYLGKYIEIDWHREAAMQVSIAYVRIELTRDGGTTWEELAASVPTTNGYYGWTVTDGGLPLPQPNCRFRVSEVGNPSTFDVSLPFSIE